MTRHALPRRLCLLVPLSLSLLLGQAPALHAGRAAADQPASGAGHRAEAEPELVQQGLAEPGAFGVATLGTLGDALYVLGSQGETTGSLAGVGRVTDGTLTHLGRATAFDGNVDYNRLLGYGAMEYHGSLYAGDRRLGALYRLVLDAGGAFVDVEKVATAPSGEDVFPGPVLADKLWLGSFGKDTGSDVHPDSDARVMTWDGTSIQTALDLADLGHGGEVMSMTPYRGELWVTAATKDRHRGQLWAVPVDGRAPRLVLDGPEVYQLTQLGGDLVGSLTSYDNNSSPVPHVVRWDGQRMRRISPDFGTIGALSGVYAVGEDLLLFHYYAGVYRWRAGELTRLSGAPPRVMAVKEFHDSLWLTANQPVSLWRMPLDRPVGLVRTGGAPAPSATVRSPASVMATYDKKPSSSSTITVRGSRGPVPGCDGESRVSGTVLSCRPRVPLAAGTYTVTVNSAPATGGPSRSSTYFFDVEDGRGRRS